MTDDDRLRDAAFAEPDDATLLVWADRLDERPDNESRLLAARLRTPEGRALFRTGVALVRDLPKVVAVLAKAFAPAVTAAAEAVRGLGAALSRLPAGDDQP